MISVNQYDPDDESILSLSGFVEMPKDEGEPDRAKVNGEYPPKPPASVATSTGEMPEGQSRIEVTVWWDKDEYQYKPDPFDHQPIPGWVTAIVIVGTLGAVFALGALFAK